MGLESVLYSGVRVIYIKIFDNSSKDNLVVPTQRIKSVYRVTTCRQRRLPVEGTEMEDLILIFCDRSWSGFI